MAVKRGTPVTPRMPDSYYLGWILKIAAASNVRIGEATQAVYLERLRKLTKAQMERAGSATIDDWRMASQMPPLPFILERAYSADDGTTKLLGQGDKPAGWQPMSEAEIAEFIESIKRIARSPMMGEPTRR